jgi:hypothetical protein
MPQPLIRACLKTRNKLPCLKSELRAVVGYNRRLEVLVKQAAVLPPLVTIFHESQIPVPARPTRTSK